MKIYTLRELFLMDNNEFLAKIDDRFVKISDLIELLDSNEFDEWTTLLILGLIDDLQAGHITITELCNALVTHYHIEIVSRLKNEKT